MRRGTSRAVPIVVSAGLAVGVFCGLMFGLGTGKEEAHAATSDKTVGEKNKAPEEPTPSTPDVTPPKSVTSPGTTKPAAGSGTTVATGSGAGSATAGGHTPTVPAGTGSAEPAIKTVKINIEIKPDSASQLAKVTVDGKDAPEGQLELDLGDAAKKDVKVVVKAVGFKDLEQKVEIEAGKDTKVQVEMVRKRSGGGLPRPEGTGGKKPGTGGKKPGGSLIDI